MLIYKPQKYHPCHLALVSSQEAQLITYTDILGFFAITRYVSALTSPS